MRALNFRLFDELRWTGLADTPYSLRDAVALKK